MSVIADLLVFARKVDNYELYSGAGTCWLSTTLYKAIVPAAKRWFLFGGIINRNVNSTLTCRVWNASANAILGLASEAAGTGFTAYPNASYLGPRFPFPLDTGDNVQIAFGTAQDVGSYASCVVLEVDV